jgi:hypothetical protein
MARLRVRHSGEGWLYYDALRLVTQQDVAIPTHTLPVGPKMVATEEWPPRVRGLLLHGFRFGEPPRDHEPPVYRHHTRDQTRLNLSVTFGFWGGERGVKLDTMNQWLLRDGFSPLSYSGVMGGLDLDFTFGRVRAGVSLGGGGRTATHGSTGTELSTWLADIAFVAGYDVIQYRQFHVFVSTGIGVATLRLDRAAELTLFPDVQPWEGDRVTFSALSCPFEAGTDYFVPFGRASTTERWVFQFGTRFGWIQQLDAGGWETDTDNARDIDGPAVSLSGPRARLVLGIGVQNGW